MNLILSFFYIPSIYAEKRSKLRIKPNNRNILLKKRIIFVHYFPFASTDTWWNNLREKMLYYLIIHMEENLYEKIWHVFL